MQILHACMETWITDKACIIHSKAEKYYEILIKTLQIKSIREPDIFPSKISTHMDAIPHHRKK